MKNHVTTLFWFTLALACVGYMGDMLISGIRNSDDVGILLLLLFLGVILFGLVYSQISKSLEAKYAGRPLHCSYLQDGQKLLVMKVASIYATVSINGENHYLDHDGKLTPELNGRLVVYVENYYNNPVFLTIEQYEEYEKKLSDKRDKLRSISGEKTFFLVFLFLGILLCVLGFGVLATKKDPDIQIVLLIELVAIFAFYLSFRFFKSARALKLEQ